MLIRVQKSSPSGEVVIPGSKSHTIRALFLASLAQGRSLIRSPLFSEDTHSAIQTCKSFGAIIHEENGILTVEGVGGRPQVPENVIDVGNSGTTLRIAFLTAALVKGAVVFTGDEQIRRRPLKALIESANALGATAFSTRDNGSAPVVIQGGDMGGSTSLDAVTSQYLTSLLINAPLFQKDTHITVTRLNEVPYVEMTLWWLNKHGIDYEHQDMKHFSIKGNQRYQPMDITIPGDFSSGTFFMVLAAITGNEIRLRNLDMSDTQGDKRVLTVLAQMGAEVRYEKDAILVKGRTLQGINIDMNDIPDALPALSVAGCFAVGETRLHNVMQARMKETDRIAVMCRELKKMGADIEELEDGLVIRRSNLRGTAVHGHGDHRIVMALAIAGLCCEQETQIDTAECVGVTFPEFVQFVKDLGGSIELSEA